LATSETGRLQPEVSDQASTLHDARLLLPPGVVESDADRIPMGTGGTGVPISSQRYGQAIDHNSTGSVDKKKQEGYF
jgi:hypothetical protein